MAATSVVVPWESGGGFLLAQATPDQVFTREDLSPAHQMLGSVAEDFLRTEVLPRAEQLYGKHEGLLRELLAKAGELDLLRLEVPEQFDGLGLDKASAAYVSEKIGAITSFATPLMAHTGIGTLPIVFFGTEQQKARYLPGLASGEKIAAYALTEPGSGSDALAARTKATLSSDGKHYLLNGQKMWITNGGFADVFIIFAKVDGDKFTAFIVEREMGVVSGRDEPKMGLDGSSTTALLLENVRVPVENVLGEIGQGHKVAFNILNFGRLKLASCVMGGAKQAFDDATRYARERQQFGRAIAEFGMIKHKIAEMAIRCYVADAMVYRIVGAVDRGLAAIPEQDAVAILKVLESFATECSISKVFASEVLAYVVDEALQIHGGYGYSKDFPAERAYRDARIARIYEGTNEINRVQIPTRLLKNPAIAALASQSNDVAISRSPDGLFAAEYELLDAAKTIVLLALGSAKAAFGSELASQQEVLAHIADIIIDLYALESGVLRASKLVAVRDEAGALVPIDMARTYASDAADRIAHSMKQVAAALGDDGQPFRARAAQPMKKVGGYATCNSVAARRRIADAVLKAGRYPF